ncbi:unnamed protein product, partial [Candidula unifasciata]
LSCFSRSCEKWESRERVKKLAEEYHFRLIQHKLRQAILKGSMAPRGSCQDLESSSELSGRNGGGGHDGCSHAQKILLQEVKEGNCVYVENSCVDTHDNRGNPSRTHTLDQSYEVDNGQRILQVQESSLSFSDRYSLVDSGDVMRKCSFGIIHEEVELSLKKHHHQMTSEAAETTEQGDSYLKENELMIVDSAGDDDVDSAYPLETAETHLYKVMPEVNTKGKNRQMIVDSAGGDAVDMEHQLETAETHMLQVAPEVSTKENRQMVVDSAGGDELDTTYILETAESRIYKVAPEVSTKENRQMVVDSARCDDLDSTYILETAGTRIYQSTSVNSDKVEHWVGGQLSKIKEKVRLRPTKLDNSGFHVSPPSCNISTEHSLDDSAFFRQMMTNIKPPMFPRKPKQLSDPSVNNIPCTDLTVGNIVTEKNKAVSSRNFSDSGTLQSQFAFPCAAEWTNRPSVTSGADVDGEAQDKLVKSGDGPYSGDIPNKQLIKTNQKNKYDLNKEVCLFHKGQTAVNKILEEQSMKSNDDFVLVLTREDYDTAVKMDNFRAAVNKDTFEVKMLKDNFKAAISKETMKDTMNHEAVHGSSNSLDHVDNTCGFVNVEQLCDKRKKVNGRDFVTEACQTSITDIYPKSGLAAGSDSDSDFWVKTKLRTIQKKIQRRRSRLAYSVSSDESTDDEEFSLSQKLSTEIRHIGNHGKTCRHVSDRSTECLEENLHLMSSRRLSNHSQNSGAADNRPGKTEQNTNELQHFATDGDNWTERQRKSMTESCFEKKQLKNRNPNLSPKQANSNAKQHHDDFNYPNCERNPKVTSSKTLCPNMRVLQHHIAKSHKKKSSSNRSAAVSADCTDNLNIENGSLKSVNLSEMSANEQSTSKKSHHSILRRPRNKSTNVPDLGKPSINNFLPSQTSVSRSKFSLGHDSKVSDRVISFQDISESETEIPDSEKGMKPLKQTRQSSGRSLQREESPDSTDEIVKIWLERENFAERVSLDSSRPVDQQSITSKVMEIQSIRSEKSNPSGLHRFHIPWERCRGGCTAKLNVSVGASAVHRITSTTTDPTSGFTETLLDETIHTYNLRSSMHLE